MAIIVKPEFKYRLVIRRISADLWKHPGGYDTNVDNIVSILDCKLTPKGRLVKSVTDAIVSAIRSGYVTEITRTRL